MEFVVGTGGAERRPFEKIKPHSQARNARAPGVLKLRLGPGFYRWKFLAVADRPYSDSGRHQCH